MAFNLEKLAEIAVPRSESAREKARIRKENREWLRMSQEIALSLIYILRTGSMTQAELAKRMGVSPVYVSKLLKGGENLTLETIAKIEKALDTKLIRIAQPYQAHAAFTPSNVDVSARVSMVSSESYTAKASQNPYIQGADVA